MSQEVKIAFDLSDVADWQFLQGLSAGVSAAHECGLTQALLDGDEATPSEWAAAVGLTAQGTTLLLNLLESLGWVERSNERYRASAQFRTSSRFMRVMYGPQEQLWKALPDWLCTGETLQMLDGATSETLYARVARALGDLARGPAATLADKLGFEGGKILDVGCGGGPWSLTIAEMRSDVTVTGLDQPEVVKEFLWHARERGLADRVDGLGADMFTAELDEEAYDVVLIAQVLRIVSPDQARELVHRMARMVRPGGSLVIVDAIAGDSDESRQRLAVYALHLAIRNEIGGVHLESTLRTWLEEAGLVEIEGISLGEGSPVNAVRARRSLDATTA